MLHVVLDDAPAVPLRGQVDVALVVGIDPIEARLPVAAVAVVPAAAGILRVEPAVEIEDRVGDRTARSALTGKKLLAAGHTLEEAVHVPGRHAATDHEVETSMRSVQRRHRKDVAGAKGADRLLEIVRGIRVEITADVDAHRCRISRRHLVFRLARTSGALHIGVGCLCRKRPVLRRERRGGKQTEGQQNDSAHRCNLHKRKSRAASGRAAYRASVRLSAGVAVRVCASRYPNTPGPSG